jgi:FtsH-binding integral membrane protein
MNQRPYGFSPQAAGTVEAGVAARTTFLTQVYGWMTGGLLVTAAAAWWTLNTPALLQAIAQNPLLLLLLIGAQLGAVIALSAAFDRLSFGVAAGLFVGYSALTGITLSTIFLVYTAASIASVFLITAGTFGAVSFWGATTKRDLTGMRSYLFMGLIGIILASVVNLFMRSSGLQLVISYVAVLVFTGLTAYDTQKLVEVHRTGQAHGQAGAKLAVYGALRLYLDFINLFLALLRILGNRR